MDSEHPKTTIEKIADAPGIIFLDIDGPVIPNKNHFVKDALDQLRTKDGGMTADFRAIADKYYYIPDPIAVILIMHLAQETGSKIVFSLTWRHGKYESVMEDFTRLGFDPSLFHDDWRTTPHNLANRTVEIKDWLTRHPEVTRFVCIDDEVVDLETHIQVSADDGFLLDNYNQAYELLTGKPSPFASSAYQKALPCFVGPDEILTEIPHIKRGMDRVEKRKNELKARFDPDIH